MVGGAAPRGSPAPCRTSVRPPRAGAGGSMRGQLSGARALWMMAAFGCGGGSASLLEDGGFVEMKPPPAQNLVVPAAAPAAAIPDPESGKEVSLNGLLAYADRHAPELTVAASTRARAAAARVGASPLRPDEPS